jgi:signal transduction histidine kinase
VSNNKSIFAKELDALYRALPLPLFVSLLNALFLAGVLYNHIGTSILLLWISANIVLTILRYGGYFYYRRVSQTQSLRKLYFLYFTGLVLSASLWGSTSIFLFPDSLNYALIVVFITGGMAAGALGSIAYRFETYLSYNLIILLPFVIVLMLHSSHEFYIMGFILILFSGMLLISSKKFYNHFHNAITVQQELQTALKTLAAEKEHIERLNRHLLGEVIEKEEAQANLEHALKEANQASIAKEAFFATMSHELRTPLNAIIGFSQILSRKKELPPEIISYIEKIFFSGRHLLDLVNTILDFSKLKSGKMEPHFTQFSLKDFTHELALMCEPIAQKQEVEIIFPHLETEMIIADRKMLYQVFLNLLSNAIKFSPKNDRIKLAYQLLKGEHYFVLCDHGPGIAPEMQAKIFDPFTQIDNSSSNNQGTGLGLAIAKEMIDVHDGKVWIESILGKGSCFHITFPPLSPAHG